MAFTLVSTISLLALALAATVNAETHVVSFDNKCGYGTPTLIQGAHVLSTGQPYTVNGVLSSVIAYLQTGDCLFNGEQCTLLELSLQNPTGPGSGSSADISLIPPHAFNVAVGLSYDGSCSNQGMTQCLSPTCNTAFFKPDDTFVQVACQDQDANLLITFCPEGSSSSSSAPVSTPTTTDNDAPTSIATPVDSNPATDPATASTSAATALPSRKCQTKRRRATKIELEARQQAIRFHRRTAH